MHKSAVPRFCFSRFLWAFHSSWAPRRWIYHVGNKRQVADLVFVEKCNKDTHSPASGHIAPICSLFWNQGCSALAVCMMPTQRLQCCFIVFVMLIFVKTWTFFQLKAMRALFSQSAFFIILDYSLFVQWDVSNKEFCMEHRVYYTDLSLRP